jgi:hypothetical protein
MNYIECQQFEQRDQAYLGMLTDAQTSDPLGLQTDGIQAAVIELNVQRSPEPPTQALTIASERVLEWAQSNELDLENPDAHAILRDMDKILGSFVMRKIDPVTAVPISANALGTFLNSPYRVPRALFYDYTVATDLDKNISDITYTGDEREIALIEIFRDSTNVVHALLNSILKARLSLQNNEEQEARALLAASLDLSYGIRRSLPDIYHRVGPEFVAMGVTRYMGGVEINGGKYEGPNPSNSAYMAVDRFVFGSMQKLRDKDPVAEAQLLKRMSYLPEHLRALIQAADRQGDDDPLWVLASDNEELRSMAVEVGTNIRKFKVGHKSFADKGLVAKGKQLTTAQPDLLSDLIEYAKTNEGKI